MFILHKKRKPPSFYSIFSNFYSSSFSSSPSLSSSSPNSVLTLSSSPLSISSPFSSIVTIFSTKWILFLLLFTIIFQSSSGLRYSSSYSFPVCRQVKSTCSSKQEKEYYGSGGLELSSLLGDPIRKVVTEFDNYHNKFDEQVIELIENSKQGFHAMFTKTYGQLYQKHSAIFTNLFIVLKDYYASPVVNLEVEFGKFFDKLFLKIFQELNSQYVFNEEYLKCPQRYMNALNPFGDLSKKLIIEFQRSFNAAKVFSQSIKSASDVVKSIREQPVTPNCQKYFIQMKYCQQCENQLDRIPCHSFCSSVMTVCSLSHRHINKEWNSHLDKLGGLINRLENSFSIESAVGPLDIKISEAIMNFQENGLNISRKIWNYCGKPRIGKRRAPRLFPPQPELRGYSGGYPGTSKSPLDQIIDEIKRNLKKFKDLWIKLPETICNSSLPTSTTINLDDPSKSCWNQSEATTQQQLTDRGEAANERSDFIKSQRLLLRSINQKLDAAYKGSEIPEDDDVHNEGGSGSGDGDYDDYGDYKEDDDDDDRPSSSSSTQSTSNGDLPSSSTTIKTDLTLKSNLTINNINTTGESTESNSINTTALNHKQSPAQSSNTLKDSCSLAQQSTTLLILTLITVSIFSTSSL